MPLPEVTIAREPMHTRAVRIEAHRSAEGAWDLEAELPDDTPFDTPLHSGPGRKIDAWTPFPLDRCHALRSDGTAGARYYPTWCRPANADASPDKETRVSMGEQS